MNHLSVVKDSEQDARSKFVAHLSEIARIRNGSRQPDPLRVWSGPEELLLSMVGEPVEVPALSLPDGVAPGKIKACYANAFTASALHPNLLYTEGFAMAGTGFFPVNHAWVVDQSTGAIVDPTWVNLDCTGPFFYMGLTFSHAFIGNIVDTTGDPSIFEADWKRKRRGIRNGLILNADGHVVDFGDAPPF